MSKITLYSVLKNIANSIKNRKGIPEDNYDNDENKIKPKDFYNEILLLSAHTLAKNMVDDNGSGLSVIKNLTISGNIENGTILSNAFKNTSIETVTFEKGVNTINSNVFNFCSNIQEFNTGVVKTIYSQAISYCGNLKKLTVSEYTTFISSSATHSSSNLSTIEVDENNPVYDSRNNCNAVMAKTDICNPTTGELIDVKNSLILGCKTTVVPDGTVALANSSFAGKRFESINLPESVKSINSYAFQNCNYLTSINLEHVTNIEGTAFVGCKFTSVDLSSIKYIGTGAFTSCTAIKEVNTNNLSGWCMASFGNYLATPVYWSRSLKLNGSLITELTIPDEITKLGNYAFGYCENITRVKFPANISSLGNYTFTGCISCLEYDFSSKTEGKIPTIETTTFYGTQPEGWKIKVPQSRLEEWKSATNWAALPEGVIIGI